MTITTAADRCPGVAPSLALEGVKVLDFLLIHHLGLACKPPGCARKMLDFLQITFHGFSRPSLV